MQARNDDDDARKTNCLEHDITQRRESRLKGEGVVNWNGLRSNTAAVSITVDRQRRLHVHILTANH